MKLFELRGNGLAAASASQFEASDHLLLVKGVSRFAFIYNPLADSVIPRPLMYCFAAAPST